MAISKESFFKNVSKSKSIKTSCGTVTVKPLTNSQYFEYADIAAERGEMKDLEFELYCRAWIMIRSSYSSGSRIFNNDDLNSVIEKSDRNDIWKVSTECLKLSGMLEDTEKN